MPTLTLKLPKPHEGQAKIKRECRRWNTIACGRRWGKTVLGIDRIIEPALQGFPAAWFSPTYKMLSPMWRELKNILKPVTADINAQEKRIELVTGGFVDMWSLDQPDAARGRKYKRVVIDEAAMVKELKEAWQAVIRPTLTDYEGDAWLLSTPKGMNFFREMFMRGQEQLATDYKSWQMPTSTNPHIKPSEIEKARAELPERTFAQEYLAQFLDDAGGVFRRVTDSATATPQEKAVVDEQTKKQHGYVFGVDWGRFHDFTVIAVIDENTSECVAIDRFNQIDFNIQRARLTAMYERFKPHTIIAEFNSFGGPNVEALQRDGLPVIPFITTNASKTAAIEALSLAFERGELRIINDPILVGELLAYEAERMQSGLMRYSAPEGSHDDCVVALALAWVGARRLSRKIEYGEPLW